jgi:hypothetical protein
MVACSTRRCRPKGARPAALTLLLLAASSCTGGASPAAEPGEGPSDAALDLRRARPLPARTCAPPQGVSGRPRSIAETVDLVNALPRPVTVACFVESLERPLYLNATTSFISLQPAAGPRSPRLFLMFEGMSLSIVPEGPGSTLIEFGEFVSPERTLKAELATPITAPVQQADPYLSPLSTSASATTVRRTTCRTCHAHEERAQQIPFAEAFHSLALRPAPSTRMPVERVRDERDACPDQDTGQRCTILRALFDHGEVLPRDFPEALPTIFD